MDSEFSEFSYGYALTDELIHYHKTKLKVAPVFPSLYDEGAGKGYDLKLDRQNGIPLFLQFKVSHYMYGRNAKEFSIGTFASPFYRMYITPRNISTQQKDLLALEMAGNSEVRYVAPAFHELNSLDNFYLNHRVMENSLWVSPSFVEPTVDNQRHHVSFQLGIKPVRFSDSPMDIDKPFGFDGFQKDLINTFEKKSKSSLTLENLSKTLSLLESKMAQKYPQYKFEHPIKEDISPQGKLITKIAFYSTFLMDTQMFIVQSYS